MRLHLLHRPRSAARRGALVTLTLATLLAALSPTELFAQPLTPDVEGMIREGLSLRRQGRDEQAFAVFESAWNASHSPRARAQMGLAAQALGRWPDADRFLREALSASADPWIIERREVLSRSLAAIDAHLGILELRCNIDGADVRIDGAPRGTTPLREPLRLPAGTVAVQLSAAGYLPTVRLAIVTTGQTTREQIDLVALPTTPATTPPAITPPVPHADVAPPVVTPPITPPFTPPFTPPLPSEDRAVLRRTLAWTTAGLAVAGVVMGGAFLALRNSAANEFNANNVDADSRNDCAAGSALERCTSAESTISTRGALSAVGFTLGGVAAVSSAVLFLTLPPHAEGARTGLRGCSAGALAQGLGATCAFTF